MPKKPPPMPMKGQMPMEGMERMHKAMHKGPPPKPPGKKK